MTANHTITTTIATNETMEIHRIASNKKSVSSAKVDPFAGKYCAKLSSGFIISLILSSQRPKAEATSLSTVSSLYSNSINAR
jgi:hypothetical protein